MPFYVFIIVLVSIVGGFAMKYQKNNKKARKNRSLNKEEVEDMRKLVNTLKKRIENLEAIAAGAPEEFNTGAGAGMSEIEVDGEASTKEQNQQTVSDKAKKWRTQ